MALFGRKSNPVEPSSTTKKSVGRQQLVLRLRERIERGDYAPGAWLPAERALADEFGVDRSTIRAAIHQLEKQKLIVREPGHRPWVRGAEPGAPAAAPIREATPKSATIFAMLPHHTGYPASLAVLHGINDTLQIKESPLRIRVLDTQAPSKALEIAAEKGALETALAEKVAGIIIWHMGGQTTVPLLREIREAGIPMVFVDRLPAGLPCDYVGVDNQGAVAEAIGYLARLGHRRIAHITTDEPTTAVQERLASYREALLRLGVKPRSEWIYTASRDNPTDLKAAVGRFFSLPEPPTAVFAMNDSLAHHFIIEAEDQGYSIPNDLSIIGFDDLERYSPRPALLTTLHQPFDNMGRRAIELLLARLAHPSSILETRHILLQAPLIVRSTCRTLEPVRQPALAGSVETARSGTG